MKADVAAVVIAAQFPERAPVRVTYAGEGCDSTAFEVNGDWIFRFPKREDVERQLLREVHALPALMRGAPVPVPQFQVLGQPSREFPRHFAGYRKLAGVTGLQLDPHAVPFDRLAPQIGRFLSWLHRVPVHEALALGVEPAEPPDLGALLEEVRTEALELFARVERVAPDAPLDAWHACLRHAPDRIEDVAPIPVFLHNDLSAEHFLVDRETASVTGVIDWSDMAVGDRCLDFAGVWLWGDEPFMRAVLEAYDGPQPAHLVPYARYLAACRAVGDVAFGLDMHRRDYILAGLHGLTHCAGTSYAPDAAYFDDVEKRTTTDAT